MVHPIEQMLLPDETVRFRAQVHWAELVCRGQWLWIAMILATLFWHMRPSKGPLVSLARWLGEGSFKSFFLWLHGWMVDIPDVVHGIIILMALVGGYRAFKAILDIYFTQMVITDLRVIVRRGVYTIDLIELDRRRVAAVMIHQSFYGRIFHYGYVYIQGFGVNIYGMPVLAQPHLIQQYLHS